MADAEATQGCEAAAVATTAPADGQRADETPPTVVAQTTPSSPGSPSGGLAEDVAAVVAVAEGAQVAHVSSVAPVQHGDSQPEADEASVTVKESTHSDEAAVAAAVPVARSPDDQHLEQKQTSPVDPDETAQSASGPVRPNTPKAETAQADMAPPSEESKSPSGQHRAKSIALSDGTVATGKGLVSAGPGIKRGPQTPRDKTDDSTAASGTESPVPRPVPVPGPAPGPALESTSASPKTTPGGSAQKLPRKRKRARSGESEAYSPASSLSPTGSRASSPEYNPSGTTRSGRVTQKPASVAALLGENAGGGGGGGGGGSSSSTATKRSKAHSTASTSGGAGGRLHPKIKRRVYRGREQLALCEHCLRGYGPPDNAIVFCDACNKCWHQRCHEPQVAQAVVADAKAPWFCADCDRILHGKRSKKTKAAAAAAAAKAATAAVVPPPAFSDRVVSGASLTTAQKTAYLQSLSKDDLIRTVLHASELAPALPLFKAALPPLPAAQFSSTYRTPASATPAAAHRSPGHAARADDGGGGGGGGDDEGYETYVDEHALLYPRAGHGIKLPPERDDMAMLLESKASRTFSHWVVGRDDGRGRFSGTADVGGLVHGFR